MKPCNPFYRLGSVIMVVAVLLPQGTGIPTKGLRTGNSISFVKHTIAGSLPDVRKCLVAVDVDLDGDIDVLGVASELGKLSWWSNDSHGTFTERTITENFSSAISIHTADIDGDEDIDLVVAADASGNNEVITWWENNGSQTFTKHTLFEYTWDANAVYAIDVDGDSDIDIIGSYHSSPSGQTLWWENEGNGSFTQHTVGSPLHAIDATDLDGDHDADIVGTDSFGRTVWYENDSHGDFSHHFIESGLNSAWSVHAIDMDDDDDSDVLSTGHQSQRVTWWENDGSGGFTRHTIDENFPGTSVYGADLDSDGATDVLGAAYDTDDVAWWQNDDSGAFARYVIDDHFDGAYPVSAADVDGDGDLDVLAAAANADELAWWESNASDFGAIDGHVRYFGPPGIFPLANVQVSVDPPRTDSMITDANGEFSLDAPQDTYVVTGTTEGYVVASSVEARTVTVTPGETAWVGFTMIDESGASGCWTPNQACANEIANIIPILGLGSEVTGVVNGLCEVGRLWEKKRYLWSVTTLMATVADIADVVLLDIPTFDWLDALAECGVHQFKELTKGWSISKLIESIWQRGAQDSDVLVIGVKVEANNSVAAQASSGSAALQVHLYSGDNHLGLKPDETLEHTIPHSFLFEWPDDLYEVAIVKEATAQYELQIEGQSIATYNLSVVNPRPDGTGTLVSYKTLTVNDGSIASLTLGQSTTDFTLEVDTDGDGNVDDYVEPESTEHVWPAILYLPVVLRDC